MTSEYARSLIRAKHKLLKKLAGVARKVTYSTQNYDSGGGGSTLYVTVWLLPGAADYSPKLVRDTFFDQFWLDEVRPRCMWNGFNLEAHRRDHNGESVREMRPHSWKWDDHA